MRPPSSVLSVGKDACLIRHCAPRAEAEIDLNHLRSLEADSIVVFGGMCKADGQPRRPTRWRCEAATSLAYNLPNVRILVVSGGGRGVRKYRKRKPSATEAGQMKAYCTRIEANSLDYLEEPFALDTLGNIVFSVRLLLQLGFARPVFVSQVSHLRRVRSAIERWLKGSTMRPGYWPVQEPSRRAAELALLRDGISAFRDSKTGLGHPDQFAEDLPHLSVEPEENELITRTAIKWLFEDNSPGLYEGEYGSVEELIARLNS